MTRNIKVKNYLKKHFSSILSTIKSSIFEYTNANLYNKLEKMLEDMYYLGYTDGRADAFKEFNKLEEENVNL